MNSVIASQHIAAPHLLPNRFSPSRSVLSPSTAMSSRKRKADDDASGDNDDRMSASPTNSPAMPTRNLSRPSSKRMRTNVTGRPLALPRLLETLGAEDMRSILRSICERRPDLGSEIVSIAPRPSVSSTLEVLQNYESAFQASYPYGGRASSDYAYNRVRQALVDLLDALKDFTPNFLPPNESQAATSLAFLDGATEIIHRLPDWDTFQHNRHKQEAYEEMAKAWASVIREAAKRAGGIQLQYGGWDQKLSKHNQISGGRMQEAIGELRGSLQWLGTDTPNPSTGGASDPMSVRQQLLSGTYGLGAPVRVGHW
ncbi:tethering factor for nuclear proteasome sts1 [Mytilinidion resinicola]|uniref:Tethering factor for nuclear proteasome STS1 n=1 Tax=Mytilinidion resinicola TaxID=574789 RepID=A0A6A6YNP3_9PEZI|nr:tethering factor for nuclear proteasome sts1 [Mytilinidion resinicola]KAF2809634.1 tethering factor for nuclear proteasome sts1 [Mytilinidion resinicola]